MNPPPLSHSPIAVSVLGSSSGGNATLVRSGTTAILIDCGFPPRYILRHLEGLGVPLDHLAGIVITHTHADHVNPWFVRRAVNARVPIYCPADIELHLQARYEVLATASHQGLLVGIDHDEVYVQDLLIRPFPVPHDSAGGCFGYVIDDGKRKVVVATDMAFPTASAISHCSNADILVLESNHDLTMLEESARPAWVKNRIRKWGHLSNDECVAMVRHILDQSTQLPSTIMLAHVSQECNTNAIAVKCLHNFLTAAGIRTVSVVETFPAEPSHVF